MVFHCPLRLDSLDFPGNVYRTINNACSGILAKGPKRQKFRMPHNNVPAFFDNEYIENNSIPSQCIDMVSIGRPYADILTGDEITETEGNKLLFRQKILLFRSAGEREDDDRE